MTGPVAGGPVGEEAGQSAVSRTRCFLHGGRDGGQNTRTQIEMQRSSHAGRPPAPAQTLNQIARANATPTNQSARKKLDQRTLTALYNERPAWLDNAHSELDAAVAAAYGWPEGISTEDALAALLELNRERVAAQGRA